MDDKTKKIVENFYKSGDTTIYWTSRISPWSGLVCLVSIGIGVLINLINKTSKLNFFLIFGCLCGICSFFSLVIFGIVSGMQRWR